MQKMTVVLDERQQVELQVILEDKDQEEALRFLKEVIWAQIQAARRKGLCGHMEQGQG